MISPADLPVYFLPGLTPHSLSGPTYLQTLFLPYSYYLHACWWMAYWGTLTYMASKYVIIPLILKMKNGGLK